MDIAAEYQRDMDGEGGEVGVEGGIWGGGKGKGKGKVVALAFRGKGEGGGGKGF